MIKPITIAELLVITTLLSACGVQHIVREDDHSGYLSHYDEMESVDWLKGKRWVSGELKYYNKVILEPVEVFPMMQLNDQQHRDTANYIATYLNTGLKEASIRHSVLAERAGEHTLKIIPAITGIVSENQDPRLHQLILPVAIARTLIQTATDRRPRVVKVFLELKLVDSVTGQLKGEIFRKGIDGQEDKEQITEEDVKELLDDWINLYESGVAEYIAKDNTFGSKN